LSGTIERRTKPSSYDRKKRGKSRKRRRKKPSDLESCKKKQPIDKQTSTP